ncbi:hypothetical protein BH10CYA1_BH10CYA1_00430 [soil metagenome]
MHALKKLDYIVLASMGRHKPQLSGALRGYNIHTAPGEFVQFETQREVKFIEPSAAVPEVELRVHREEPTEPAEQSDTSTPPTPGAQPEGCPPPQAAETNHVERPESKSLSEYQTFSESFGSSNQSSSRSVSWDTHLKQPFNTAYFIVATAAIATVCILWNVPVLWLVVTAFGAFALAAFRSAWNSRSHPDDFAVNLSPWTRRSLRAGALLLPIPFFAILLAQPMAYNQLKEGQQLFQDGKYKDALVHFNIAATLKPRFEEAYMELADCYNFSYEYDKSLASAEKALQLDPTDGAVWASKAWALNKQNKFAEALPAALKAVNFAPGSGQANHALAEAYVNLGEYDLALAPATKHVKIHEGESGALEQRADVFEKLGRSEEAARDRAAAAQLDSQNSK